MLRKETISGTTLELLKELIQDDNLKSFFLVGGTSLSLQIGHRISIDLDLFTLESFHEDELVEYLEKEKMFQLDFRSKNTIKGQIGGVKVDFIRHSYPLVKPLNLIEEVRLASLEDIAAMKLNAIVTNGSRVKDFVDIAYLSTFFSLAQMIEAYETKYSTRDITMVSKSLHYYGDINFEEPIELVVENYSWELIKERLDNMAENINMVFSNPPI